MVAIADIVILAPNNPQAHLLAESIKKDLAQTVEIVESLDSQQHYELIITVGTEKFQEASQRQSQTPVIAAFISPHDFENIHKQYGALSYPIFSAASPRNVIRFLEMNFKGARIGYVYKGEKDAYLKDLDAYANDSDITLVPIELVSDNLFKTYRRTFQRNLVDIMLVTNDPNVYTSRNIRFALESLYREKIPAIGLSKQTVKAGAVAAVYTEMDAVVAETTLRVNNYIAFGNFNGSMYANNINVLKNDRLALEYKLTIQWKHWP